MMSFRDWYSENYQNKEIRSLFMDHICFEITYKEMLLKLIDMGFNLNETYVLQTEVSLRPSSYSGMEYVLYSESEECYFSLFDGEFISKEDWFKELDDLLKKEIKQKSLIDSEIYDLYLLEMEIDDDF